MQLDLSSSYRAPVLLWLSLSHFWKHGLWCGCLRWLTSDIKVCKSTMPEGMASNAVLFCLHEDKDTLLGEGSEMQQVMWAKPMTRCCQIRAATVSPMVQPETTDSEKDSLHLIFCVSKSVPHPCM